MAASSMRRTYLRFEVPAAGTSEGEVNGIFVAAYDLCDSVDLQVDDAAKIVELLS